MRPWAIASIAALGALAFAGCAARETPSYDDGSPASRIAAIDRSAREGNRKDIPRIVENLSSDDAAVRMAAIGALRRMTGETLGYRFDDPAEVRREAISRWSDWARANP
jgi:HEAT repeat protein